MRPKSINQHVLALIVPFILAVQSHAAERSTADYKHKDLRSRTGMLVANTGTSVLTGGDVDGDGILDGDDLCSNTPPNTLVDAQGRPLGDIDQDCDTDLTDYALFQLGTTGPLEPPDFDNCSPLEDSTGCLPGLICYVALNETDPTLCAGDFEGGIQGDACQFVNNCADRHSCVLLNDPFDPTGLECAFICDTTNTGGPTCGEGPGPPFQCMPINGFYGDLPEFPIEIGMCIDPNVWIGFDEDGDGVLDISDACPNTPKATPVDANGCSI